ncbi:phage antirepressor KilAC domain-containing protein [Neisseriaceae bacterium TC5R-5]|nr:phage antirepressor KilAC domain-containing protein [Neisseriaceae bacterium TC5R-5]
MSSREIAELVEARHDSVKRAIERLVERGVIQLPPLVEVKNHLSQTVQEYRIGKRDSYVIVAQLSPEFTARLVDRWQELEQEAAKREIPKTLPDALRLAAELAEETLLLEKQLAEQAPKAQFHDDVCSELNGQTLQETAKELKTGRTRLCHFLRKHHLVMANLLPYQRYIDQGFFRVVHRVRKLPSTGETLSYPLTLVTGKGLTYLYQLLNKISLELPEHEERRHEPGDGVV